MNRQKFFFAGFREMLPITTGIIPFGAVMGTVTSEAHLNFLQSTSMNMFVFAGAAQMAAMDLMSKNAAGIVVIATGLIINLRFLLYSAALSPVVQRSSFLVKLVAAHLVTDQSYAVMSAHQDKLPDNRAAVEFYAGAAVGMFLVWNLSVMAGLIFGNFAPASWGLDFAVPLSFISLVIPTLKNRKYVAVAAFSSVVSILLHSLPYRVGLICTSLMAIGFAALLTRKRSQT